MSVLQHLITIFLCAAATVCTRFLPFLLFSRHGRNERKALPPFVSYLGNALPAAIFGMLVVYCLKNTEIFASAHGLPEAIAIVLTILLHLWKRKMLLSIAAGTACYMLLVQFVFP